MANDIEAGRAFVTLYVRDRAFRQQMADNEQLYQQSLESSSGKPSESNPQLDQLADSIQGYELLDQTASESMSSILQDTEDLAEQTERLNDALESVMASYQDLAGMQEEGITLSIGGGQGGHGGGMDNEGWLDTGEIEHTLEGGAVGAIGKSAADVALKKTIEIGKRIGERLGGRVADEMAKGADGAIDALGNKALNAGQKLLTGPTAGSMAGGAGGSATAIPSMGNVAAATQGVNVVMAELVPVTEAATAAMAEMETVMASLAPVEAEVVTTTTGLEGSLASIVPVSAVASAGLEGTEIVMAEIVPVAEAATAATTGLGASLMASLAPAAAIAAVAAAVLVPVLAAIDDETGGTLSNSGYYPEWLKKIGDAMGSFGLAGPIVHYVVSVFKELWGIVTNVYELFSNLAPFVLGPVKVAFEAVTFVVTTALKVAFFPLSAALFALNAPFRLVHMAVDTVKSVFGAAQAAVVRFVDGVRALPGLAASAATSVAKLAASMASATWNAYSSSVNTISSGLQSVGKMMAIVGGGMAAIGAAIVTPLAKAAETFASHGKEVAEIAKKYDLSAEAAATYAYMASQTGMSVKDLTKSVKEGSEEFAQWNRIATASGWTVASTSSAVSLAQAYKEVKDSLHGLWVQLGQAVAPAVEEATRLFTGAVRIVTNWVRNNQELIASVFRVASTIATVGSALATAGGAMLAVGAAMTPFTVALAGVAGGLALVEYKTKAGATLWGSYKDSIVNVFGTVMSYLSPIVEEVQKVVGGIKDAVMGGRIDLAFTIVMEEVKAVWAGGLGWLAEKTGGVFGDILGNLAAGNWKAAADGAMGMVTAAFWRGMDALDEIWTKLENIADEAFEYVVSVADEAWGKIQDAADPAWLWLQDMFAKVKKAGQDAFAELGVFAAGLGAAFADVAEKLKLILIGLSAANPLMAGAAIAAVNTMGMIKGSAVDAYTAATGKARKALSAGNGAEKPRTETERDAELAERKKERDEARAGRGGERTTAGEERRGERTFAELERSGDREDVAAKAEQQGRSPAGALNRSDLAATKESIASQQVVVDVLWEKAAKKAQQMTTMENNPAVYGWEKQAAAAREWEEAHKRALEEDKKLEAIKADAAARTGPVAQAQAGVDEATKARDEAIEKARAAREAMGTPEDPAEAEKATKHSGLLTTSAYAFGQFGSGDPQRDQLSELKKTRQEAADERKQRDKDWADLLGWMKFFGTKSPEEARNMLFDMMG